MSRLDECIDALADELQRRHPALTRPAARVAAMGLIRRHATPNIRLIGSRLGVELPIKPYEHTVGSWMDDRGSDDGHERRDAGSY